MYKTGFASSQEVYEEECQKVFKTLDFLENYLNEKPRDFLIKGSKSLTESDVRLYVTLIRFGEFGSQVEMGLLTLLSLTNQPHMNSRRCCLCHNVQVQFDFNQTWLSKSSQMVKAHVLGLRRIFKVVKLRAHQEVSFAFLFTLSNLISFADGKSSYY